MKRNVRHRGFTLIELLVVLAIIAVIAALSAPTAFSALRGSRLTQGEQAVVGVLELARRTAITTNRTVEVRFYRYAGKGNFASDISFRSVQVFEMTSSSAYVAVEKVQFLPDGIILDSNAALSSVFDQSKRIKVTGTLSLPGIGTNYTYMYVRFFPDGSTDLLSTAAPWFATLHDETKGDNLNVPPANFITLQVDPVSGTITYYRP